MVYFIIFCFTFTSFSQKLPEGFVYLNDIDATIKHELRYFSDNNFIGKPINGYHNNCVIVTIETAKALKKVQEILVKENLSLKIYDAYRPQQAVDQFVKWAKVLSDTLMKQQYYPRISKNTLFKKGYIASKSGHTRGSTVDLTIINLSTKKELDMGSPYDFFGLESHVNYAKINTHAKKNRLYLRKLMTQNGFKPYNSEWWHFTLLNEPFKNTYFNFKVE